MKVKGINKEILKISLINKMFCELQIRAMQCASRYPVTNSHFFYWQGCTCNHIQFDKYIFLYNTGVKSAFARPFRASRFFPIRIRYMRSEKEILWGKCDRISNWFVFNAIKWDSFASRKGVKAIYIDVMSRSTCLITQLIVSTFSSIFFGFLTAQWSYVHSCVLNTVVCVWSSPWIV